MWKWEGGTWHFVSLPEQVADEIDGMSSGKRVGFGSVRVEVTIGSSTWRTSVFPDTKRGTYVLPVKKAVRVAEALEAGSTATIELSVLE